MSKNPVVSNPAIDDLRETVAQSCRILGRLDLTATAYGHVSARIPGTDRILIRARGPGEVGVRYTADAQVVEVDLAGSIVASDDDTLTAPLEVFIHTNLYKARPDVNAVIHIHPPTVVLFTICDKPLLPIYGAFDPPTLGLAMRGVPTYEKSVLISDDVLGRELAQALGANEVCTMRGHGITSVGTNVADATMNAIGLCDLAEMNYRAALLGNPRPISDADQAAFRELEVKMAPAKASRTKTLWNYYVALTGA